MRSNRAIENVHCLLATLSKIQDLHQDIGDVLEGKLPGSGILADNDPPLTSEQKLGMIGQLNDMIGLIAATQLPG